MLIEVEMKARGESETQVVPIRSIFVSASLTGRSGSGQPHPKPQPIEAKK